MRDPFGWSFPVGRMFGITIRVHFLFPIVALGMVLRAVSTEGARPEIWADVTMLVGLLFISVLLHEFGHCFAARQVGGDAPEVLLWPLGGLAAVDVPHNPRANFLTAAGGPAVNLVLCAGAALALAFAFDTSWQPPWNPLKAPLFINVPGVVEIAPWNGASRLVADVPVVLLARFFWVNWTLLLLNVVLAGFPMDGGRMFQAILWHYVGYRQGTLYAVYLGFFVMFVVILAALAFEGVMLLLLAWFIYTSCRQQWIILETGGEDSLFGYDFSQGYTSLERDESLRESEPPPPPPKKVGFWQRWLDNRAERKRVREAERKEADERRMDELLDKIQRHGKESLTDEEHRFLKRVAERYKNRQ